MTAKWKEKILTGQSIFNEKYKVIFMYKWKRKSGWVKGGERDERKRWKREMKERGDVKGKS